MEIENFLEQENIAPTEEDELLELLQIYDAPGG